MELSSAAAGALPALAAMWYVDHVDRKRPEPRNTLRKVAIAGGLATLPAMGVQLALERIASFSGFWGLLFNAFVSAAAVEELCKALCLLVLVWRRPEFNERFDGIVYATRAGLGFALVENVGYLLGTTSAAGYATVFIARSVLAVPGHAIFAGMMGYFAARRRFDQAGPGIWGGLALAVLLHGTYDVALFSLATYPGLGLPLTTGLVATPIAVVWVGFWALRRMADRAIRDDDAAGLVHHPHEAGTWSGFTMR
jgi:RsiW-degrading membrane proteinase PrsW (M82 family)